MSERVYILPTRKIAALFLREHPLISIEHVFYNTDIPPTKEFPIRFARFRNKQEAGIASTQIDIVAPNGEPLDPRFFSTHPLTGTPMIKMYDPEDLSQENQEKLVKIRMEAMALKHNHESYIRQGWFFVKRTNIWSIPVLKFDWFMSQRLSAAGGGAAGGGAEMVEMNNITESDELKLRQIAKDVDLLTKKQLGVFVKSKDVNKILTNLALILKQNGALKWGNQCRLAIPREELLIIEGELKGLDEDIARQTELFARASEIERPSIKAVKESLEFQRSLKDVKFRGLSEQRALPYEIEDIDTRIEQLAYRIQLAHNLIRSTEKEIKAHLTYAERVQLCSDEFEFDISDFTEDIYEIETMIASFHAPACELERDIQNDLPAEHLSLLQLFSLSLLNSDAPEAAPLLQIDMEPLMPRLNDLARLAGNQREGLYNMPGNYRPATLLRRAGRFARGLVGNFAGAASTAAREAPDDVYRQLASRGLSTVREAGGIYLGKAKQSVNRLLTPTYINGPAYGPAYRGRQLPLPALDVGPERGSVTGPSNGGGGGVSIHGPSAASSAVLERGPLSRFEGRGAFNHPSFPAAAAAALRSGLSSAGTALGSARNRTRPVLNSAGAALGVARNRGINVLRTAGAALGSAGARTRKALRERFYGPDGAVLKRDTPATGQIAVAPGKKRVRLEGQTNVSRRKAENVASPVAPRVAPKYNNEVTGLEMPPSSNSNQSSGSNNQSSGSNNEGGKRASAKARKRASRRARREAKNKSNKR